MRTLLLLALLAWSAMAEASLWDKVDWNGLWQTADQRGEQLMKQGNPAAAVGVFKDPRRKAYAELRAGDYQRAAHDFAALDDGDSQYNRGNALARAGDLQGALKAYDAALKRDPNNRDARHNRDLVAQALKHPPPKQQSASGDGKQGKPRQNDGKQSQSGNNGGGQSGQAGNQDKTGQNGKQNGSGKNSENPSGQGKAGTNQAKSDAGQNKPGTGQNQPSPSQTAQKGQAAPQTSQPGSTGQAGQAGQQAHPPGKDSAAEALADAQAALHGQANGDNAIEAPLSEKQLAQQDWLRRIPDDPGGLLRRKFMIEHMLRQQGGQQ